MFGSVRRECSSWREGEEEEEEGEEKEEGEEEGEEEEEEETVTTPRPFYCPYIYSIEAFRAVWIEVLRCSLQ